MAKSNRTNPNTLNLTDHERQEIDRPRLALTLFTELMHKYSDVGDPVIDPFAGVGTAAVAALAAGRTLHRRQRSARQLDTLFPAESALTAYISHQQQKPARWIRLARWRRLSLRGWKAETVRVASTAIHWIQRQNMKICDLLPING